MPRLSLWFLGTSAACLVAGVVLGLATGMANDFQLSPIHAHLNLLGWTSLALMGLTAHAFPELAQRTPVALTQFALAAGSALAFPVGIWLMVAHDTAALAVGSALVWVAGAGLFLARLLLLALQPVAPAPMPRPAPVGVAVHQPIMMAAE